MMGPWGGIGTFVGGVKHCRVPSAMAIPDLSLIDYLCLSMWGWLIQGNQ